MEVCRRAHIGEQVEVGNNLTPSHSKTRPADILIPNWVMGRTAALDVSVTSPLNPQTLLEAGVTATAAALTTEEHKHDENDPKCSELGWVCIPGAWGREATLLFSTIASRIAPEQRRTQDLGGGGGGGGGARLWAGPQTLTARGYGGAL